LISALSPQDTDFYDLLNSSLSVAFLVVGGGVGFFLLRALTIGDSDFRPSRHTLPLVFSSLYFFLVVLVGGIVLVSSGDSY